MSSDPSAAPPQPAKKLPAWVVTILKFLVTVLLGTGVGVGAKTLADRTPDPVPPEISLPAEFKGEVGQLIELKCETTGTIVRWRSCGTGLNLIDDLPDLITKKGAYVIACKPGSYRVECWSAIGNSPTWIYKTTVVIGEPGPAPPVPVPPTPVPPTPIPPSSELAKKLQAAYTTNPALPAVKLSQKNSLTGLYLAMVDHAKNPAITTTTMLLADLKAQSDATVPASGLIECRKVISEEVRGAVGSAMDAPLDPDIRGKAVDVFGRVAKALTEVK